MILQPAMIMGYPKITLVTPSYQQAHYLPWTLRSVIDQDYPDLEYLVCDGGSTDGSVEVIRSSERHLAWWCSERDGGQAHAINKGFRRATGDIVGWLNSDDMLLPGCLRRVASAFADPQIQAICGWGVMMSAEGRVRRRWVFGQPSADRLRFRSILFQPSVFWRRSVMDRIGLLDESFRFCMDQDFFTRMAEHGIVPRLLPRFLAAYRSHPLTKTSTLADVCADESARITGRRGSDAPAVSESVSSRACRLFWHKLMIGLPPYRRGLDIHALFRR